MVVRESPARAASNQSSQPAGSRVVPFPWLSQQPPGIPRASQLSQEEAKALSQPVRLSQLRQEFAEIRASGQYEAKQLSQSSVMHRLSLDEDGVESSLNAESVRRPRASQSAARPRDRSRSRSPERNGEEQKRSPLRSPEEEKKVDDVALSAIFNAHNLDTARIKAVLDKRPADDAKQIALDHLVFITNLSNSEDAKAIKDLAATFGANAVNEQRRVARRMEALVAKVLIQVVKNWLFCPNNDPLLLLDTALGVITLCGKKAIFSFDGAVVPRSKQRPVVEEEIALARSLILLNMLPEFHGVYKEALAERPDEKAKIKIVAYFFIDAAVCHAIVRTQDIRMRELISSHYYHVLFQFFSYADTVRREARAPEFIGQMSKSELGAMFAIGSGIDAAQGNGNLLRPDVLFGSPLWQDVRRHFLVFAPTAEQQPLASTFLERYLLIATRDEYNIALNLNPEELAETRDYFKLIREVNEEGRQEFFASKTANDFSQKKLNSIVKHLQFLSMK